MRTWGKLCSELATKVGEDLLNIAEIELSLLIRQCLAQRIPDRDTLAKEVSAWEEERNAKATPVNWRFTTEDARIKLKRLYPTTED